MTLPSPMVDVDDLFGLGDRAGHAFGARCQVEDPFTPVTVVAVTETVGTPPLWWSLVAASLAVLTVTGLLLR
jgi:hypothetical protein